MLVKQSNTLSLFLVLIIGLRIKSEKLMDSNQVRDGVYLQPYSMDPHSKTVYINPDKVRPKNTLIFLHGLGDSAEGLQDIFHNNPSSPICNNTRVILLTAPEVPVTINGGAPSTSWFDIKDISWTENSICQKEVNSNTEVISKVIEQEISFYNGDASRVFIGGFSQGCCMALHIGLSYPKKLGGIIGLSGLLFPFSSIKNTPPILISHGTHDFIIPFAIAEKSYQKLIGKQGVTWQPVPGGSHGIPKQVFDLIKKFWTEHAHK